MSHANYLDVQSLGLSSWNLIVQRAKGAIMYNRENVCDVTVSGSNTA